MANVGGELVGGERLRNLGRFVEGLWVANVYKCLQVLQDNNRPFDLN